MILKNDRKPALKVREKKQADKNGQVVDQRGKSFKELLTAPTLVLISTKRILFGLS